MFLRTEILPAMKLVGKTIKMSFAQNKTVELWQGFMPHRDKISNRVGNEFYSLEVYGPGFFDPFIPEALFDKWAAVAVSDYASVPEDMQTLDVPEGLYAVFLHKGPARLGEETYRYIFAAWLPASAYTLDHRPHMAVMGSRYRGDHPESEEEIWIPVMQKNKL